MIDEAFALADSEVQKALSEAVRWLRDFLGERVQEVSLRDVTADEGGSSFKTWADTFCVLQWAEIQSCVGAWIANARPEFGAEVAASFELTNQLDRRRIFEASQRREQYYRGLHRTLGPNDLLCIPTTPALAPHKGHPPARSSTGSGYYPRTLSLTSIAAIGRMAQVSLPIAHAEGVPVGLSLLARQGQDQLLLEMAKSLPKQTTVH